MDGTSLEEWKAAAIEIRKKHGREAEISAPIARRAIASIRKLERNSQRRIGFTHHGRITERDLERAEQGIFLGLTVSEETSQAPSNLDDGIQADHDILSDVVEPFTSMKTVENNSTKKPKLERISSSNPRLWKVED